MSTPPPDGTLRGWSSIRGEFDDACALLCGNGLSINVWSRFDYASLFDHALDANLSEVDLALFSETQNFERVLSDLVTAIRVDKALGIEAEPVLERYRSIQRALGHAIREVHVRRVDVPDEALLAIRSELKRYAWVFSTSYDLIAYWAMGCGGSYRPFVDLFKGDHKLRFDADQTDVYAGQVPVYFPHGALHLVVGGDGETWKMRGQSMRSLLDQFGEPIPGDAAARPLLVTEGTSRDKLRAIEGNAYLAHCLGAMRKVDLPFVVFGASLGDNDNHLVDALNGFPSRPVAVSMVREPPSILRRRQAEIYARLQSETLHFFDAATHPLGSPALRVG